jgi:membrane-associated phospholipid phosphatase
VLGSVMLVSAVPSGNHYLADVIGGLAVAALAILCARPAPAALDRLFTGRRLRRMETHDQSLEL